MMNNKHTRRNALVALIVSGLLFGNGFPLPAAQARSKGRRNTAYFLGALSLYGLASHNRTLFIGSGGGAALAYSESLRPWDQRYPLPQSTPSAVALTPSASNSTSVYGAAVEPAGVELRGGRADTAKGLGALTAFGVVSGKATATWAGGIATFIALRRYRQSKKAVARSQKLNSPAKTVENEGSQPEATSPQATSPQS